MRGFALLAVLGIAACHPQPNASGPLCRAFGMCMGGGDDPPPRKVDNRRSCTASDQCAYDEACVASYRGASYGHCTKR